MNIETAKFDIGTKVRVKGKEDIGMVAVALYWDCSAEGGYLGYVYNVKFDKGYTEFGRKETDLEAA